MDPNDLTHMDAFPLLLDDEHLLLSYLDEYLNANGKTPHVAGVDSRGTPFLAWLNEEGGDSVYLSVMRLIEKNGGASEIARKETPGQGETSSLVYPVTVIDNEA